MNQYTINTKNGAYKRISKTAAIKEYMNGKKIFLIPCKVRFDNVFILPYCISRESKKEFYVDEIGCRNYFINTIASFEYYNCNLSETGKYTSFYTEV